MKRFKIIVAYDGTGFLGWQSQKEGGAVQDVLEGALKKVFKKPVRVHGASRTDSGVHAWGQTAHFDAEWQHGTARLKKALQALLPPEIFLRSLAEAPRSFHARFSAKGKRYLYRLKISPTTPFECRVIYGLAYKIDLKKFRAALALFKGKHNFTSFAGGVNKEETAIKILNSISVSRKGALVTVNIVGSGFLYRMARSLVGTALEVARGKLPLTRVKELLRQKRRTHEVVTAPAKGLMLERVMY